ncbi:hypothetical protein E2562_031779 [Oryza meyeriana var. granulata]|uniref:Uncharacterized protein n=1 Tax=Oryza meyeriana var. granulata TaxID=110450 RepID=A0A6G1CIX7_9ORYZ|nr:hypothetical protein E2562_031779 [Oryza meyeriana var. granulata]
MGTSVTAKEAALAASWTAMEGSFAPLPTVAEAIVTSSQCRRGGHLSHLAPKLQERVACVAGHSRECRDNHAGCCNHPHQDDGMQLVPLAARGSFRLPPMKIA